MPRWDDTVDIEFVDWMKRCWLREVLAIDGDGGAVGCLKDVQYLGTEKERQRVSGKEEEDLCDSRLKTLYGIGSR